MHRHCDGDGKVQPRCSTNPDRCYWPLCLDYGTCESEPNPTGKGLIAKCPGCAECQPPNRN